ncbi:MAG: sialate O-acetylesterase [Planctomycetota bacterium]
MRRGFIRNQLLAIVLLCCTPLASADIEPDAGRHLFMLSGQSNMTPMLAKSFRRCMAETLGRANIVVAHTGHPGQPIKRWYKDWRPPAGMTDDKPESNGKLYDALMRGVERAVKGGPIATVTFIWMQGEADADRGWGSVYADSFMGLLEQLKRDLEVDRINFVAGRINEFWLEKQDGELMRQVLQSLGEDHANGDWVDTDDLNRGVNPWGGYSFEDGHYPPSGYVVMGQRFAKAACRLIDPDIALDPAVYEEVFFDASGQIKTHAAIGKAFKPAGKAYSALTDGRFAPLDHNAEGWVAFAPCDEPIELVIDLGQVMSIDSIAVHTLLSSGAGAEFPNKFVYSVSTDGRGYQVNGRRHNTIHFYSRKILAKMRREGIAPTPVLLITEQNGTKARYIKIEIQTGDQQVLIDEIVVNPSGR